MKKLFAVGAFLIIMLSQLCIAQADNGWYESLLDAADVDKTRPTDKQQLIWDDTLQLWFSDYVQGADIELDVTNFNLNLGAGDSDVQTAMETLDDLVAGGGSGDAVQVNGSDADTTANFTDGDIDFTLVDGGAGGPDGITAVVSMAADRDITMGSTTMQEDSTKDDIVLTNDLDIEDPHGHLGIRDTDTDGSVQLHYDGSAVAAPYQEFSLWLGTDDGTGFEKAGLPYIHITTAGGVDFPGSVTVGDLTVDADSGTSGYLRLNEDPANGANYLSLNAPSSIASNRAWTMGDVNADFSHTTNGWVQTYTSATRTWEPAAAAGGGTPAGADTQLQYNDGGSFGGLSAFTWDDTDFLLGTGAATKLQFRDAAIYIASLNDGYLDLEADTEIRLNANVTVTGDADVTDATPHWGLIDTDGDDYEWYADGNRSVLTNTSDHLDIWYVDTDNSFVVQQDLKSLKDTELGETTVAGTLTVTGGSEGSAFAAGITIDEGTDHHIRLTGDPSNATPVDGDLWWNGTQLYFYNGSSSTNLLTASAGDAWGDAVDADILPTGADNTYDIGGVGATFADGYFSGTLDMGAGIIDNVATLNLTEGGMSNGAIVGDDIKVDDLDFTELSDAMTLDAATEINTGAYKLTFKVANPGSGAFDFDGSGAYTGDLVHMHQHTGNPGAGSILTCEAEDMDVDPLVAIHQDVADITADTTGLRISCDDDDDANWIPLTIYNDLDGGADLRFKIDYLGTVVTGIWNAGAVTSSGTVEGATLTEGGQAVSNDTEIEAVVEPLIDTLANLTNIQSLAVALADAGADAFYGWNDGDTSYKNLTDAEALIIIGGTANDFDGSGDVTIAAADISDQNVGTDITADLEEEVTAGSLADDTINDDDINWVDIANMQAGGGVTLSATATALATTRAIGGVNFDGTAAITPTTIVVADTVDTAAYIGIWEEATGSLLPKTDAGITYNAGTGTLDSTVITEGTNAVSNDSEIEAVVEPLIDTLANLTSIQSLTVGFADAGVDAFWGWDDTASTYENLTAAEALAIIGGAANDFDGSGDISIAGLAPDTATTQAAQPNITSLGSLTGLTMAGDIQLGETDIKLDATLSGDAKWSGIVIAGTSGVTTLAVGDLCYLNNDDGRWELVDANLSDGYDKQLGICVLAGADGAATEMLTYGKIRSATLPALTIGSPVYMSETAGDVTHTAPTTTDAAVRIIGFALTAEDLLFNPSNDYYTHT